MTKIKLKGDNRIIYTTKPVSIIENNLRNQGWVMITDLEDYKDYIINQSEIKFIED